MKEGLTKEYLEWLSKSEKLQWKKFILKNHQCPGDILMLTACVRDIKIWYPEFEIGIDTTCDEIFHHNPNVSNLSKNDPDVFEIKMDYEIIHQSNQNMNNHFIHGFIIDFNEKTGYSVKLTNFKPDIHLTDQEKEIPLFEEQEEKFIVLNAGGKTDYMTKWWWTEKWEEIIKLCPDIQFIQIGKCDERDTGAGQALHNIIQQPNVLNKINKTSIRDVLRLVYQSIGTLSVVTSVMHMAAAFDKHAAVIAGGHEPWWWEKYPKHDYFHSIGTLSCCKFGGCWLKDCENKNEKNHQKCLETIDPRKVAESIHRWYRN